MADGALFGLKCFSSNDAATDAYYSTVSPSATAGSPSYYSYYSKVNGTWMINQQSRDSSGAVISSSSVAAPSIAFPICDTTGNFTDGMTMGWGIAAAMAVAYGFVAIKRGLA